MNDLTVTETARELGLARATVLKQIRNGRLAAERVGPIFVVSREEIERYRAESLGRPGQASAAYRRGVSDGAAPDVS